MKLHIIVTAFHRPVHLNRLILDFILQSNKNWQMYIVHDGPALKEIKEIVDSFGDKRIGLHITPRVNGFWGHPNRAMMLDRIQGEQGDYVLITNDDNQYTQNLVATLHSCFHPAVGFIYYDCLHNYFGYDLFRSDIKVGGIDMGSFVVRLDIAKKVGFTTYVETADGVYAVECAAECRKQNLQVKKVSKVMFIHN